MNSMEEEPKTFDDVTPTYFEQWLIALFKEGIIVDCDKDNE